MPGISRSGISSSLAGSTTPSAHSPISIPRFFVQRHEPHTSWSLPESRCAGCGRKRRARRLPGPGTRHTFADSGSDGGGRKRGADLEDAGGTSDCGRRRAPAPARGRRTAAGVERARRGRVPSRRARSPHGICAGAATGAVPARTRAWRSVAGRRDARRAGRSGIWSQTRRRIASGAASRRDGTASRETAHGGRGAGDGTRVCAAAATQARRRRAGAAG